MQRSVILTDNEIKHKIKRIAFQIYENNSENKEVIIAGIAKNGFLIANQLKTILETISTINVTVCEVKIDKKKPLNLVETSIDENEPQIINIHVIRNIIEIGIIEIGSE